MKQCNRCGQEKLLGDFGTVLVHFFCDECRRDGVQLMHAGRDVTLETMEYQLPRPLKGD